MHHDTHQPEPVRPTETRHPMAFKISTVSILLLLWFLVFPSPVQAYVDPGTGSYFIQLVVGGFLALLYALRLYWSRIRSFLSSKVHRWRKP